MIAAAVGGLLLSQSEGPADRARKLGDGIVRVLLVLAKFVLVAALVVGVVVLAFYVIGAVDNFVQDVASPTWGVIMIIAGLVAFPFAYIFATGYLVLVGLILIAAGVYVASRATPRT